MTAEPAGARPRSLADFVRVYDDALPPALCRQMIDSFDALARFQRVNGRSARAGLDDSAWTELDLTPLSDRAFRQMLIRNMAAHLARYRVDAPLSIPVPDTERTAEFIVKRYRPDGKERFQPHFDSVDAVCDRYLVFLWYLNDVALGGETRFVDLDLSITPRAGRLVIFPPYWMFQHEGAAPRSGDKYILSTYYLFDATPRPWTSG